MTILACDLGGTRLKIGVVRDGKVLAQAVEPAHSQLGLAPQLPVLRDAWLRLLGGLKLTPADCAGVTVAFPSLVDNATGRILAEYGKFADAMSLDLRAWARALGAAEDRFDDAFDRPSTLIKLVRYPGRAGDKRRGAGCVSDRVV